MSYSRVSAYPSGLDASGLSVHSNGVIKSMTGNTNFPDVTKPLKTLSDGRTALEAAINAKPQNVKLIKSLMNRIKKVLRVLAADVDLESDGDEVKAASSGFYLISSSPHPARTFAVYQGELSGAVDLECANAGNRAAYVWEMCADPMGTNPWQQIKITNSTVAQLNGLTAGNKYWFRVKAIVKDKEQAYADPVMLHVI